MQWRLDGESCIAFKRKLDASFDNIDRCILVGIIIFALLLLVHAVYKNKNNMTAVRSPHRVVHRHKESPTQQQQQQQQNCELRISCALDNNSDDTMNE